MSFKRVLKNAYRSFKSASNAVITVMVKATAIFERAFCYIALRLPQKGFSAFSQVVKTVLCEKSENNTPLFNNFKHLMREKYTNNKKQFFRFAVCVSAAVILVVVGATNGIWTQLRTAVDVKYNGINIGRIASAEQFGETVAAMKQFIIADNDDEILADAEFKSVITMKGEIQSPEELVEGALQNTDGITEAYGLYIDGTLYSVCKEECYNECMENELAAEKAASNILDASASYLEAVTVKKAYYTQDDVKSSDYIKADFSADVYPLTVALTFTETTQQEVPYTTVETEDSGKVKGYSTVTSKGVNGLQEVVSKVSYVDGIEVSRTVVSTTSLLEPVAEQVTVGTAEVGISTTTRSLSSAQAEVGNYGWVWPVEDNAKMYVSAYYGDGRGHKGMDICSPQGTGIYAVQEGVVVKAGYNSAGSGFGNCVVIEHANGLSTLYAHCNELFVEVGDVVTAGETIAAVGSTGDSDGNHLHFEVRVGNSRVDPAPYLGIN